MRNKAGSFLGRLDEIFHRAKSQGWSLHDSRGVMGFSESPLESMTSQQRDNVRLELEERIGCRIRSDADLERELIRALVELAQGD